MTINHDKLHAEISDLLQKHYGKRTIGIALVIYEEDEQYVRTVNNMADRDAAIALMADGIKTLLNLPVVS